MKKYTILDNVKYAIKRMWRHSRFLFVAIFAMILVQVALPILNIYIPKLILSALVQQQPILSLLCLISALTAISIVFRIIEQTTERYVITKQMILGAEYILDIDEKAIQTDYENISSELGQTALANAYRTTGNDSAPTRALLSHSISFIKNLIGLGINGLILSQLSPLILVMLAIISIVSICIGYRSNRYRHQYNEQDGDLTRQFSYLKESTYDVGTAKDIRLYSMKDLILHKFKINISQKRTLDIKKERMARLTSTVDALMSFFRDGIAYAYLVTMILINEINISDFVLFLGSINLFSSLFSGLSQDVININRASLGYNDFRKFMEMKDHTNRDITDSSLLPIDGPCSLEFDNISFAFDNE